MIPVTIDIETYWSVEHSLSKMPPIKYVLHPDTEIISVAVKVGNNPTQVAFGFDAAANMLNSIDWSNAMVIGHNMAGFDSMLLAWRFGIRPKIWACTLSMARPIHARSAGGSLAALVKHYDLGVKDNSILLSTKGKHLADFTEQELEDMKKYNTADVEQTYALFLKLLPTMSKREMRLIDMTVRMLTEPKFELDNELLQRTLDGEQVRMRLLLMEIANLAEAYQPNMTDEEAFEAVKKTLASPFKFAALLEKLDQPIPKKLSPTTNKLIPALAKTDEAFIKLMEHSDPIVSMAARARMQVKSTLLESRIKNMLVSQLPDTRAPVFLNYYAAHTGRWGGGGQLNQQNFPRIPRDKQGSIITKPTNALRLAMKAPKGHKVVVSDLSGIELRVNHTLWRVPSTMALYKADPEADLYRTFGSRLFNCTPEEVTKDQRQLAKVAQLGLGFWAGAETFRRVAKAMAGLDLSESEAQAVVDVWRTEYREICAGWKRCEDALRYMASGVEFAIDDLGLCTVGKFEVRTPQGRMFYPNLRKENGMWVFGNGRHRTIINGGKMTENLVQHLAREVIADNALAVYKATCYYPTHMVHDELVYVVPESEADAMLDTVNAIMRKSPSWWPDLITWSEGSIGDTYGEAK